MNRKTIKQTKCLHDYVHHCTPRKTRPFTLETLWTVGVGTAVFLTVIMLAAGMIRGIAILHGWLP